VNQYAGDLISSIPGADPYRSKGKGKLKTYPKPGTGFRESEADNPAPNSSGRISYHAPIGGPRRANTITGPTGSFKVGTDRIYGHRDPVDPNLTVGVSYHDKKKPVPAPPAGGTPSRNHPFSVAEPQKGGRGKVALEKLKIAGGKVVDSLKIGKKKK
jgi:hypothetical protein